MHTLKGGIFCENGKEIGEVIDQRRQRGRRIFQAGQLAPLEGRDSVRITITGIYLAGGGVNDKKYDCEIVSGDKRIKVYVENAFPKTKAGTTDIVLSPVS